MPLQDYGTDLNNFGYGYPGDVNNSIGVSSAYPGNRSGSGFYVAANRMPMRNNDPGQATNGVPEQAPMPASSGGMMGKPSHWWLSFAVVFVIFVFVSRKYGGGDGAPSFSNIKLTVYNGIFLTIFIVLMLNLLKVFAAKVKVPGLSELILAA